MTTDQKEKDRLTTRQFWVDYWAQTKVGQVPSELFLSPLLHFFPKAPATFLEIGGFPGMFTTFFKKYHNYDVTLLDFVIVDDIIREIEKNNILEKNSISIIEGDLFSLTPSKKFDVVFSAGFIEHFKNVEDVFRKHVEFLNEGGTLYISVPNFTGLNGFVQKTFDRSSYDVHNIDVMELAIFEQLCAKYKLKIKFLDYFGSPHMWLDHPEKAGFFARKFVGLGNRFLRALHLLTNDRFFKGRTLSPYIGLIATL